MVLGLQGLTSHLDQSALAFYKDLVKDRDDKIQKEISGRKEKEKEFRLISLLNNFLSKVVVFKGKCYINCLETIGKFFNEKKINKDDTEEIRKHLENAHKLLIREIEKQEHFRGNLFRVLALLGEYFHRAYLDGDPSTNVNALFYYPVSDAELEIKAWWQQIHFRRIRFRKEEICSASIAWREKTMLVIPSVPGDGGRRTRLIDAKHAEIFKSCIAYPILDYNNPTIARDYFLGILQVYSDQDGIFGDSRREKEMYESVFSGFAEIIRFETLRYSLKNTISCLARGTYGKKTGNIAMFGDDY
jgi:hypothetical protein